MEHAIAVPHPLRGLVGRYGLGSQSLARKLWQWSTAGLQEGFTVSSVELARPSRLWQRCRRANFAWPPESCRGLWPAEAIRICGEALVQTSESSTNGQSPSPSDPPNRTKPRHDTSERQSWAECGDHGAWLGAAGNKNAENIMTGGKRAAGRARHVERCGRLLKHGDIQDMTLAVPPRYYGDC